MQRVGYSDIAVIARAITLLAALLVTGFVQADDSIILDAAPELTTAAVGDVINVDVRFQTRSDFPTLGGGFDVVYDPTLLEPLDFHYAPIGLPEFQGMPNKPNGRFARMSIADFNGLIALQPETMATFAFRIIRAGASAVGPAESEGGFALWASAIDFGTFIIPDFERALVVTHGQPYPVLRTVEDVVIEDAAVGVPASVDVRIDNEGTGPLTVSSIGFVPGPGLTLEGFAVDSDGCSGKAIAAASGCTFNISYTAAQLVPLRFKRAAVEIHSSDLLSPTVKVDVLANIRSPEFDPPRLEYFEARDEFPWQVRTVTLTNVGDWPASVDRIELSDPNAPPAVYSVASDDCSGRELMPGDGCEVSIRCRPWFEGGFGGRYKIVYADETFSDTGFLGCYTPTGLAIVDYDGPQSWPVNIGDQAQRRVTITNKGPVPLAIESLSFSTFSIVEVIDNNCEDALLPFGHFCFMDLQVSPPEERSYSWLAFISTNSFYRPNRTLSLSVQGLDPARRARSDGSGRSR